MSEMAKFNFRFLWTFLEDQYDFETTFPINNDYVSVLVIYAKIKRCSGLKGTNKFSYKNLREFVSDAVQYRTKQYSMPTIVPLVQYINPWQEGQLHEIPADAEVTEEEAEEDDL